MKIFFALLVGLVLGGSLALAYYGHPLILLLVVAPIVILLVAADLKRPSAHS